MLVIGGMAMLCFAPQILKAEDTSSEFPTIPPKRVFSNVYDAEPRITPVIPEKKNLTVPQNIDRQETGPYRALIEEISKTNGVDPDLIDAVMKTESNYNRWAVSSKGARGLMQLIPETGRRFGVRDFFDPKQNIEGGVRYIKFLLEMFHGDVDLSLAGYNAGENLVARLGKIPPITETRDYVRKIRAVYTKPVTGADVSIVNTAAAKPPSTDAPKTNEAPASVKSPDKIQETPLAPISTRVDDRGVTHFSNIEPRN